MIWDMYKTHFKEIDIKNRIYNYCLTILSKKRKQKQRYFN